MKFKNEKKYNDYVIKKGKFIGNFDEMYKKISDPWLLLKKNKKLENINYKIIYHFCDYIKNKNLNKNKIITLEIGCGYPQISNRLHALGYESYATDISKTIISKSKKKYPKIKKNLFVSKFLNYELYDKLNPDVFILSDVSWYVLPELKDFLKYFKSKKNRYLIHSLAIYNKNKQKYGREYFYDLESIKKYFKLNYIYSGYMNYQNNNLHSYFLGKV
jgi:hypothetical protein